MPFEPKPSHFAATALLTAVGNCSLHSRVAVSSTVAPNYALRFNCGPNTVAYVLWSTVVNTSTPHKVLLHTNESRIAGGCFTVTDHMGSQQPGTVCADQSGQIGVFISDAPVYLSPSAGVLDLRSPGRALDYYSTNSSWPLKTEDDIVSASLANDAAPVLVDATGLPLVPAGFYTRGDLNLRELQSGLNSVIRVGAHFGGANTDFQDTEIEAWLTRSDQIGSNVFLDVSHLVRAIWTTGNSSCCQAEWDVMLETVNKSSRHSSVRGWYVADEPDHGSDDERVEVVRKAAALVRETDAAATGRSSRPVLICLDTAASYFTGTPHYQSYVSIADILLTDPYPVTGAGHAPDYRDYLVPDLGDAIARTFQELRNSTRRPLMLVEQATGAEVVYARTPSVGEARLMAYASLIAGGVGIFQFHMASPISPGCDGTPVAINMSSNADCSVNSRERSPLSPNLWNELRRIALEMAELTPALLSELPAPVVNILPSRSFVNVTARAFVEDTRHRIDQDAGGIVILVVNHDRNPGMFALRVSVPSSSSHISAYAQLIFEDRSVDCLHEKKLGSGDSGLLSSCQLTDFIDGFSSRAYRIALASSSGIIDPDVATHSTVGRFRGRPDIHPNNTVENPSFEYSVGGGGTPDGINILVGDDPGAVILSESRDSVHGLHCLR